MKKIIGTKNKTLSSKHFKILVFLFIVLLFFVKGENAQAGDISTWGAISDPLGTAGKIAGNLVLEAIAWLLYFVFQFVAMLLGIAGILFDWVIKTDNVKFVLDNTAIYESWKMVRDMLNLAFILVLLFSAFCTIFQVEKYHLKKILLTLVIMALLVNFSFPISRFIIDVSNVAFYFIVNSMLSGQSGSAITSTFGGFSEIVSILKPEQISSSTNLTYLIAAIVFTFILMITLLVIAVMFVIRLVALGILIIFSPVGFVAAIFPSTKHYADDWWTNLFKYSFFAPIMIFMMAIALNILAVMNKTENGKNIITSFLDVSGNNVNSSSANPNLFGSMAYFTIPIVILWAGLITAQKLSIAGAGVVTNQAKKFAGWAGRLPWRGIRTAAVATGVPGGLKQKYENIASRFKAAREKREAWVAEKGPFKVPGAGIKNAESRAAEYEKNHESDANLIIKTEAGDAGAALALVKRGKMDDKIYGNFVTNNKNASIKEHVAKKLKKNRVDVLIEHKLGDSEEIRKAKEAIQKAKEASAKKTGIPASPITSITDDMAKMHIEKEEYGNLKPEDIKSQYWNVIVGKAGAQSKNYIKRMFMGLTDEAKEDIGKAMSKNNRTSIDSLRKDGIFI